MPQDFEKAAEYLNMSVEKGCIDAIHSLGIVYLMTEQFEKVAQWFEKAEVHGLPDVARMLGAVRFVLQSKKQ